ncbi:hypothetical protein [Deinococcus roseus]|uniref:Uncharacterized protein n=1 Tax=Deinococcus roseus TaxID=392414 RepID=A0ABQ2DID4_9DEIO|nr:hypothetical protein [Deinococcus roseus]GGJ58662.1 hypothetical protein GCM10008938_50980 [Deinococcus roseus]
MRSLLGALEKELGTRQLQTLYDHLERGTLDLATMETLAIHIRLPDQREEATEALRRLLSTLPPT